MHEMDHGKLRMERLREQSLESKLHLITFDKFRSLRVIIVTGVGARIASLTRGPGPPHPSSQFRDTRTRVNSWTKIRRREFEF